jgi:hypothetical protein
MKMHTCLDRLEEKFISEPTILYMPDGKEISIAGPKDYLLTLCGLCSKRELATKEQAEQLDLIQRCVFAKEPGGSRLVELMRCYLAGPVPETNESMVEKQMVAG